MVFSLSSDVVGDVLKWIFVYELQAASDIIVNELHLSLLRRSRLESLLMSSVTCVSSSASLGSNYSWIARNGDTDATTASSDVLAMDQDILDGGLDG